MNSIKLLFVIPFLFACAHRPHPEISQSLFPPGSYQHQVKVSVTQTKQQYPFTGVISVSETHLKIYMMGPMNLSVVKMSEDFKSGQLQIENYFPPFKPYEGSMKRFYEILRSLILFPRDKSQWGVLKVLSRDSQGRIQNFKAPHDIEIEIKKYAPNHPILIELNHPQFKVVIEEMAP
jgi:hypothetical protein